MVFSAACQRHMMVQYCCDSGSTNKLFCKCCLPWQESDFECVAILDYFGRRKITRAA